MLEKFLQAIKKIIPKNLFDFFSPFYHHCLAFASAFFYGFPAYAGRPAKKLKVIGVTGTKGKSSVVYLLSRIFDEAGIKNAALSSIEIKINDKTLPNISKMTMPGRFFIQKFLKEAAENGCEFVVLEVTSQGIEQFRHKYIDFEIAVFTNLAPEHIESHGSFEKYREAKLKLFRAAKNIHVINADDKNSKYFLEISAKNKIQYGKNIKSAIGDLKIKLPGEFNYYNALAAGETAFALGISQEIIGKSLEKIEVIPGRLEFINEGQPFKIVIDYAHTPDSLEKVYQTLKNFKPQNFICLLGAAGGGRDKWKRPAMGEIAAKYCDYIILTNEDPYDENPLAIIENIESGFSEIPNSKFQISKSYWKILDRAEAITKVLGLAKKDDVVILTGKGSERWMMLEDGKKIPWNEKKTVAEALQKL